MSLTSSENHSLFKELLYLESDGELGVAERRRLQEHLESCGECRGERQEIVRLGSLLDGATVPVDAEFTAQVMKRLPEAGWEARSPAGWRLAVAVFVLLAVGSTLLAVGGKGLSEEMPILGAASALIGLFRSALVAGGGLLAASWTGLGLALERALDGSRAAFVAFGVLVLGIDLLFVRLLLRHRRARAAASSAERDDRS